MTVSRILNEKGWEVFTVADSAPLQMVIDTLAQHKVGVLVVTGADGALAGIVSERDVVRALAGNGAAALHRKAAEVMTSAVETCTPEDLESAVMQRMNSSGVRHLPVLAGKKLAGIISMRDVIRLRIAKIDEMMSSIRREVEQIK